MTTAKSAARQLREIADLLAALAGLPIDVRLTLAPESSFGSVKAVDTVAAALGMTAEPSQSGGMWCHQAKETRDGVHLWVYTYIDRPAERCACGAVCTHTGGAT